MQIFNDEKQRIGILSGFKDRTITTTLTSGDKELSFEYPANGNLVDLLKEEYYIRTQTDEFVLKATEKGEQWNKYTAVLNVEELEGTQFPYGFASNEQTIRACLEFAFEGTGWTVGTCTATKKRTIDEEGNVSAWDVLQKCLSTYRCECVIDSLNKRIDIYETIGSDKGCYFMEGLNLRKLTPKSDTYDFYTRIYPIGKDGITPEWLLGKDYIDNFQYSKKVKAYVWKDERYTNTTSLIEDATAKLEELSRPYVAFTATVADLARANPEYKDILSYSIGDTVDLISKTTRTKEKQRIVKIVEYPESPEKNTAELSNARKTFAEMQQEETKSATEEAVSISNRTTKKVLENYSTTEEMETKITASKEAVELGVMHTLESYYDITETDALIKASKGEIELGVSQTYQTKAAMGDYSTTKETQSLIDLAVDEVEISVSETLESYSTTSEMNAAIKVKTDEITSEVNKKVDEKEVGSIIEQKAESIRLKAEKLIWEAENSSLTEDGTFTCENGIIKGTIISKNATITGGSINIETSSQNNNKISLSYKMPKSNGQYISEWKALFSPSKITVYEDRDYTIQGYTDFRRETGITGAELYVGYNPDEYSASKAYSLMYVNSVGKSRQIYFAAKEIYFRFPYGDSTEASFIDNLYTVKQRGDFCIYNAEHTSSASTAGLKPSGKIVVLASSSKRYKHDITEIDKELDPHMLYKLPVHSFTYNDGYLSEDDTNNGKRMIGFIAEEVNDIYPLATIYDGNGKVEMWNAQILLPAMLKLIQEQHEEILEIKKK